MTSTGISTVSIEIPSDELRFVAESDSSISTTACAISIVVGMIVAMTLTEADVTLREMSSGRMPSSVSASFALKETSSKVATSPETVVHSVISADWVAPGGM